MNFYDIIRSQRVSKPTRLLLACSLGWLTSFDLLATPTNDNPPDDYSFSLSASPPQNVTGPKYRKIALNGFPLSDEKPQAEAETDGNSEETYIDAFSLSLNHSVTDIYIPVPGSDLSLSVRRNAMEESWQDLNESLITLDNDPAKPFGPCWSSNLAPNIRFQTRVGGSESSFNFERYIYVVDETGASHRFIAKHADDDDYDFPATNSTTKTGLRPIPDEGFVDFEFKAMPSSGHELDTLQSKLEVVDINTLKFTKKYGTVLIYEVTNVERETYYSGYDKDAIPVSWTCLRAAYLRLVSVTDRKGNSINYEYPDDASGDDEQSLIPSEIRINNSTQNKIEIVSVDGRVQSVKDLRNNSINYFYNVADELSRVERPQTYNNVPIQTKYSYETIVEVDETKPTFLKAFDSTGNRRKPKTTHVNIKSITDANDNTYVFNYIYDTSKFAYNLTDNSERYYEGYYQVSGQPRLVSSVVAPDGASYATFDDGASTLEYKVIYSSTPSPYTGSNYIVELDAAVKESIITDAEGNVRKYTFEGTALLEVPSSSIDNSSGDSYSAPAAMLYYTDFVMTHPDGKTEQMTIDPLSALAPSSITDYSGNITTFDYTDLIATPSVDANGDKYFINNPEPNVQTNALGDKKFFEYKSDSNFNFIMSAVIDEEGRRTEYEVDSKGRRTSEKIYNSSGSLKQHKSFEYHAVYAGVVIKETTHTLLGDPSWATDLVVARVLCGASDPSGPPGYVKKEIVDPTGKNLITEFTYDANGNRTSVKDPRGRTTYFVYDALNRLTDTVFPPAASATDASAPRTSTIYDARSNRIGQIDENGNITVRKFDSRNRMTSEIRVMGSSTLSASNPVDFEQYTPVAGVDLVTKYEYNHLNAKTKSIDPKGNATIYVYDSLNRIVAQKSPVVVTFDAVIGQDSPRSPSQFFVYGDNCGSSVFNSDSFKPTLSIDPRGFATKVQYDALYRPIETSVQYKGDVVDTGSIGTYLFIDNDELSYVGRFYQGQDGNNYLLIGDLVTVGNADPPTYSPRTIRDENGDQWELTYSTLISDAFFYKKVGSSEEVSLDYSTYSEELVQLSLDLNNSHYAQTTTAYDKVGNVTSTTDDRGHVTEIDYDALNRPTTTRFAVTTPGQVNPLYGFTLQKYTSTGLAWSSQDELGRITQTEYDGASRPVLVRQPALAASSESPITETVYDAAGNVIKTINPLDKEWDFEYDDRNRQIKQIQPAVAYIDHAYDPATSTWTEITGTARPELQTAYDDVGNVISTTDARGNTSYNLYDRANRPTVAISPQVSVYDAQTDSASLIHSASVTVYDLNSNIDQQQVGSIASTISSYADALNATINIERTQIDNTWDALNRLVSTVDAANITVSNKYDTKGNRTAVVDGKGQRTEFDYDGIARNTVTRHHDKTTKTLTYDGLVQTQRTDEKGQVTTYAYDARNRLSSVNYPGNGSVDRAYTYDRVGNILAVDEVQDYQNVAYTYDELNRIVTETSNGVTHTYTYDLAGNRLENQYGNSPLKLVSTYDALNRTKTIFEDGNDNGQHDSGEHLSSYEYDLAGNIQRKNQLNNDSVTKFYDALGRAIVITGPAGTDNLPFYQYQNQFDLYGSLTRIDETYSSTDAPLTDRTIINTYDGVNRLTEEAISTVAETISTTYTYDDAHNRTRKKVTQDDGTTVVTVEDSSFLYTNSLNQIDSFTDNVTGKKVSYTYDANGNRLTSATDLDGDTINDHTTQYVYDYENRLVQHQKTAGSDVDTYHYAYDYRTRRTLRDETGATDANSVSGAKTYLVFSGGVSVQEWNDVDGNHNIDPTIDTLDVQYVRGSDYGGGIGGILYTLRSGDASVKHYNSRGDVVAAIDALGSLTYQAAYEAFGQHGTTDSSEEWGSTADRQQANTKDEDPTGLLNEGFRYRDLETGTFITRDPLGFVDGPNVYTYVVQNPWTKFDPLGLFWDPDSGWWGAEQYGIFTKAAVVDPAADTFNQGSEYMADGFQSIADGNYVEGALQVTAAVGKAAELTLDVATGGKGSQGRKAAQNGIEASVDALTGATRQVAKHADEAVDVATDVNKANRVANATDTASDSAQTSSRAARREAMREEGIPTSQQPSSQSANASGREYTYEVPADGGGVKKKSVQQQTMDSSHTDQPHWEAGDVKTDPLTGETRMNNYDRPKLTNEKTKVEYEE